MSKKRQCWSKELIIERIRERHRERLSLSSQDVLREDCALYQAASSSLYFGSWEAAVEAAGFDYESIRKQEVWSKELIVERLRKRHSEGLPLNSWDVKQGNSPLYQAACNRRYFGSWKAAIEAAGLSYDDVRKDPMPYWSKELAIERIQKRYSEELSLSSNDVRQEDYALHGAAYRHFGSWEAAVEAAGFDYESIRKRETWSKQLIIACILERYRKGLSLSSRDVQREDCTLYAAAIHDRYFGSWEAAVEAAGIDYANIRKCERWSKELIIELIIEMHQTGFSLNSIDVRQENSGLYQAACSIIHFGSWEAAIEAAGLSYDDVRKIPAPYWSKELIIERIQERAHNRLSISVGDVRRGDPVLYDAAASDRHFGSWEAAVEAAGFSYPRVCKIRRMKDLSRSSGSEDRVAFLQNLGSRKKSRERKSREEERG